MKTSRSLSIMCGAVALLLLLGIAISQTPRSNDTVSLSARLQRLEDTEEIRTLLLDYGRLLDLRDLSGYSQLFAKDGEWVGGLDPRKARRDGRSCRRIWAQDQIAITPFISFPTSKSSERRFRDCLVPLDIYYSGSGRQAGDLPGRPLRRHPGSRRRSLEIQTPLGIERHSRHAIDAKKRGQTCHSPFSEKKGNDTSGPFSSVLAGSVTSPGLISCNIRTSLMIGRTVSHYRIVDSLGRGGMGLVYKAEDTRLSRAVALKFVADDLSADPNVLERFRREAQSASALNHPNICTIYDIGESEGRPFIAMEFLQGQTLKDRLSDGPLKDDALLEASVQLASALGAAHTAGILHRDIKPANIFVTTQGQLKILDFGLAKLMFDKKDASGLSQQTTVMDSRDLRTRPGSAIGTFLYMSPEQARGEELDARSDLFSLGAVLYEMATGRPAFTGNTTAVLFDAILNRNPIPPTQVNPNVPHQLEEIICKLLEKDREQRYQSASELEAELRRMWRDGASGASPYIVETKSKPKPRDNCNWPNTCRCGVDCRSFVVWFGPEAGPDGSRCDRHGGF